MKKRIVALILFAVLLLTALSACGGQKASVLTAEQAQEKALTYLNLTEKDITEIHNHVAPGDVPAYSFHITCGDKEYSVLVDAVTGEILE